MQNGGNIFPGIRKARAGSLWPLGLPLHNPNAPRLRLQGPVGRLSGLASHTLPPYITSRRRASRKSRKHREQRASPSLPCSAEPTEGGAGGVSAGREPRTRHCGKSWIFAVEGPGNQGSSSLWLGCFSEKRQRIQGWQKEPDLGYDLALTGV